MSIERSSETAAPRLSRVVLAYLPENFDQAVTDFTSALGIDFEMLETLHIGLRVAMSLEAGVEIVTPVNDQGFGPAMRAEIDRNGEGFQQFILQVPDLEEAADHAKSAGWDSAGFRVDCFNANQAWREKYARMEEAPLPPINGVSVTLIEMMPHD